MRETSAECYSRGARAGSGGRSPRDDASLPLGVGEQQLAIVGPCWLGIHHRGDPAITRELRRARAQRGEVTARTVEGDLPDPARAKPTDVDQPARVSACHQRLFDEIQRGDFVVGAETLITSVEHQDRHRVGWVHVGETLGKVTKKPGPKPNTELFLDHALHAVTTVTRDKTGIRKVVVKRATSADAAKALFEK